MGEVKWLEEEYPIINSEFVDFCASCGIVTVEDFLINDLNTLFKHAEKQSTSLTLKQGIDQLLSIVDCLHRPWLNAAELLANVRLNKHTLPHLFGVGGSDHCLNGALREGFMTELVGPSSSGKTQVCLRAAANIARGNAGGVIFLDTGNCFSAPRVARLINQHSCSTSGQENPEALHKIMKNIWCYPVFDIFSLLDVLHILESKLKCQVQTGEHLVRLLIVDSFSSLIVPVLGGGGPYGHALLNSTGSLLKKMANEYNVCVLVTNHMVGGEGGSLKPALGESWKSIPHVRVLLSRDQDSNIYGISVLKHPSAAAMSQVRFAMGDS